MLVVFGGRPGVGKTTVAQQVASLIGATYLRIDAIEQALRSALGMEDDVADLGYVVAYALSETALRAGCVVVADCVNPLPVTRNAWREAAARARSPIIEVEVVCSDVAEHRRRVTSRESDIPGLVLPTWDAVVGRDYADWLEPRVVVHTSRKTPAEAAQIVLDGVAQRRSPPTRGPVRR